jgi:3'(2'), 5'-bisphosphate nucleotidase
LTTADDHVLARDLAEEAGRLLLDLRARGGDPDALRKAGDRLSHEFLVAQLAARRPGDAVLSEEGIDDKVRLAADRVWIVDPLDGTREFGEEGRTDWAVHVALWERAAPAADTPDIPDTPGTSDAPGASRTLGKLTAGAVALPAQGEVLSTVNPPDLSPGGNTGNTPLRLVVSRSRAPQLVRDVAGRIGAELVPCGSAGAKVGTVLSGQTDAYLHAGGFYEWDTAAPVAVATAAGYHASRIDGSDLVYNRADPLMPDILVCRPAIAGLLLDAIREATHAI